LVCASGKLYVALFPKNIRLQLTMSVNNMQLNDDLYIVILTNDSTTVIYPILTVILTKDLCECPDLGFSYIGL